jgi:hypothetical protein
MQAQRRAAAAWINVHATHAALHMPMHLNRVIWLMAVRATRLVVHGVEA